VVLDWVPEVLNRARAELDDAPGATIQLVLVWFDGST
jgi:hypothetical protein